MIKFVIGNGRSRLGFDLMNLRRYGQIYGCNALYREFTPDYLISVDRRMVMEICESGFHLSNQVWTNPSKDYVKYGGLNYFVPRLGWSSGPSALHLASKHNPKEIFILGFDFTGINGKVNNVYADSNNYVSSNDIEIYYGNWQKQTEMVIKNNPDIKYYRLINKDYYDPDWKYRNFKHITYENFNEYLGDLDKKC